MARLSLLLTALAAIPFIAFGGTDDGRSGIGRYQLTATVEGLYFLDTATGELWLKVKDGEWHKVDSPVDPAPPTRDAPAKPVSLTLPKAGETMPMLQPRTLHAFQPYIKPVVPNGAQGDHFKLEQ